MIEVCALGEDDRGLQRAAQHLLGEYLAFLDRTDHGGYFDREAFVSDLETIPAAYLRRHGAFLLALEDGQALGCLGVRQVVAGVAEIKRLYVCEAARGRGVARMLVQAALDEVSRRGFRRAILDTQVEAMPAAFKLYRSFGFREYAPRRGLIAFLDRTIR